MANEQQQQQQHAYLFEEALLRYKNATSNNKDEHGSMRELGAQWNMAQLLGSLCQQQKPSPLRQDIQALNDQMQWQMDKSNTLSDLWKRRRKQSSTPASDTTRTTLEATGGVVDVDGFFAEYPECARQDLSEDDDDDQESLHRGGCRHCQPAAGIERPVSANAATQTLDAAFSYTPLDSQQENHPPSTQTLRVPPKTGRGPPPTYQAPSRPQTAVPHPYNPYATSSSHNQIHHKHHQQQPAYSRPQVVTRPAHAATAGVSWDHAPAQNQQPLVPVNPFQTARQFAGQEASKDDPPYRAPADPYQAPEPPPATVPIPESLKRKFQPPKRSSLEAKQGRPAQGRQTSVQNVSRAVLQGRASKPAGQTTNSNDDDDDELPEELKRFGKDLVEKITNEIMDNCGESITFDDIAGLADAKQTVQEVVCWPMKRPDLFTGLRRAPNGLLLYGPPGTGKTLIGKAIAHESGATFFSISSSSLTSKWIGQGEKLVRTLFAVAAYREPAVVFIDEIDSLLTQRKSDENEASRRIKTEFLVQLDGTGTAGQGRVLVIGATNRPQELDEAARRRFTKRLYIPLPEQSDRQSLLTVMLKKNHHRLTQQDIAKLACETAGFSGADLKALCTDAAMGPIRQLGARALEVSVDDVPPIGVKHFRQALRGMNSSVAPADLVQYEEWDKIYGTKRAMPEDDEDEDSDN